MITIVAKNVVKEDKIEEFKSLAEVLINESRKEAGCLSYNLNEDLNYKNVLTFIEEWESKEAIQLHNSSVHFTTIVPKLGELCANASEVNLYVRI